tara:strand:+ start:380 stop:568 length:189 start_codon:yes stop_codon:yes gene_type:complete
MVNMSKMKKAFHDEDIQITTDAMNMLRIHINKTVQRWVDNSKRANLKRLKADNIWVALNKFD